MALWDEKESTQHARAISGPVVRGNIYLQYAHPGSHYTGFEITLSVEYTNDGPE